MIDSFQKIIDRHIKNFQFSETDYEAITNHFKPTFLKKGEKVFESGQINRKMGFVLQGLFRLYYTKDSGDEVSSLFPFEGYLLGSYESIVFNKPTSQSCEALEDSVLLLIDYNDLVKLYDQFPNLERFGRLVAEQYIGVMQMRLDHQLLYSPEQRYLVLLEIFPEIINRVPLHYIASALGITPVSLSRIRKRIANKKS